MSGAGHIGDQAAFLAALPADDPERRAAESHAAGCPACRAAMAEGERLLGLLAEGHLAPALPPEVLARLAAKIESRRSTPTAARPRRWIAACAGAVALMWIAQLTYGGFPAHSLSRLLVSLAVLSVAVGGAVFGLSRLRAAPAVAVAAMLVASALLAYLSGQVSILAARAGVECLLCEVVAAAVPWFVVTRLARWRGVVMGRAATVAIVAAGALASQAGQHLSCSVADARQHALMFHFGGVALLAALAWTLTPSARAAHETT